MSFIGKKCVAKDLSDGWFIFKNLFIFQKRFIFLNRLQFDDILYLKCAYLGIKLIQAITFLLSHFFKRFFAC